MKRWEPILLCVALVLSLLLCACASGNSVTEKATERVSETVTVSDLGKETETNSGDPTGESESESKQIQDPERCEHEYGEQVLESATCAKAGRAADVCKLCGDVQNEREILALEHVEVRVTDVAATCDRDGTGHTECALCHETLDTFTILSGGHDWGTQWVYGTEATDETAGEKSLRCRLCDSAKDVKSVNATGGLSYSWNGTLNGWEVTGYGDLTAKDIVIPATYCGDPVVRIGTDAFYKNKYIVSIYIPSTVKEIGTGAFRALRNTFTTVTIASSELRFEGSIFSNCDLLKTVCIQDLAAWCAYDFNGAASNPLYNGASLYLNGCEVKALEIPEGVTSLDMFAFYGCKSIESVKFPASIEDIPRCVFSSCSALASVEIAEGAMISHMGSAAFSGTAWYQNLPDGFVYLGNWLYTFKGDSCPAVVEIPDDVAGIAEEGLGKCYDMESLYLPASIKFICETPLSDGFDNGVCLTAITVDENNYRYRSAGNCIIDVETGVLLAGCQTSVIPDDGSVTAIGDGAFSRCKKLSSIRIPASVTYIGEEAFEYTAVTEVVLPEGVTQICDWCFYSCEALESVTLPSTLTAIGKEAFAYDKKLVSIVIPEGVTDIGECAFEYCDELKSITLPSTLRTIGDYAFNACESLESIYYPGSSTQFYQNVRLGKEWDYNTGSYQLKAPPALSYALIDGTYTVVGAGTWEDENLVIPATYLGIPVTAIQENAFYYSSWKWTSVTIEDGVKSIGAGAFADCENLVSVSVPDSVVSIGQGAFFDTAWLDNQPDGVIYVGNVAYSHKGTLPGELVLREGIVSITDDAFSGCSGVTGVTIPDGVTSIGAGAFSWCRDLTSLYIPGSVTSIGEYAFSDIGAIETLACPVAAISCLSCGNALKSVTITGGECVPYNAFQTCYNLEYISVADSVLRVEGGAFGWENPWLNNQPDGLIYIGKTLYAIKGKAPEQVVIADGTLSIADCVFVKTSQCKDITAIVIPDSVTSIGGSAFAGCENLTDINIPKGVVQIPENTFNSCTSLTEIVIPDSVTSIGNSAFYQCSSLSSVTIGSGVTSIGEGAFMNCDSLTEIHYNGTKAQWNLIEKGYWWRDEYVQCTVYCTDGTITE